MPEIADAKGRRVWDSRGRPTVEAEVVLSDGTRGRAIAPAGASRGRREALDLRDGGTRIGGQDVTRAVTNVAGPVRGVLLGRDPTDQAGCDAALTALDPSHGREAVGGNAMVAASLAVLDAGARAAGVPRWRHVADLAGTAPAIPLPEIQVFGGGAHAGRRVDVQDFMVMVPGAADFEEAMAITREIYFAAGDILARRGALAGVADEGGWWPDFASNEAALETLVAAIEAAGERPGERVVVSLDVAASELGEAGRYRLALDDRTFDAGGLIDLLGGWLDAYPIASIEDPLGEDDVVGMAAFTARFGGRVQVVGDDYLVTDAGLVRDAAEAGACNAVLVKVNQIGTVSAGIEAFAAARAAGWGAIVSARSGETEDVAIAHLSVGLGCGQLKVGSFQRSERMAKWNEVLRISEDAAAGRFAGGAPLHGTWWGRR